jgi:hypothetical protein
MTSLDLSTLDNQQSPPNHLYKYLSKERIDSILKDRTVRFTPLVNTNDTFEIRSTFEKLAGPKLLLMLSDAMRDLLTEDSMINITDEVLKKDGSDFISATFALQFAEQLYGIKPTELVREHMRTIIDTLFIPFVNDPKNAMMILEKLGRNLLCFSLSERMDSSPMWAHYAGNNTGFIVAFSTTHEWFKQKKNKNKTRLHKVTYFNGKLAELFENPQAAITSKATDWAYEREWRMYIKNGEEDLVAGDDEDPIQLLRFPPEAVDRIILGTKMHSAVSAYIREIVAVHYPGAKITRAIPNPQSHAYDEMPE